MPDIKTHAVVLRYANYKEYHRMLTLYSPTMGKLSASAPASRRVKSPLRAASELFTFGEFVLSKKGNTLRVKSASIVDSFYDIRLDIEALSCATYLRDFCEAVIGEDEPQGNLFMHFVRALSLLGHDKINPRLVRCAFEVKAMEELGFRPEFTHCARCMKESRGKGFMPAIGGLICEACAEELNISPPKHPQAVTTLKQMQAMPLERLSVIKASDKALDAIDEIWPSYVRYHLDRRFKSSGFMDRSRDF